MSNNTGRRRPKAGREAAEAAFDRWLNSQLHAMYADVAHEPLPPSLVLMLKGLERPSRSRWTLSNVLRLCGDAAAKTHKEQSSSDADGESQLDCPVPGSA